MKNKPHDSADLDLKIVYKNFSDKPDSVYSYFLDGDDGDENYNLEIQMEEWNGEKYSNHSLFYYSRIPSDGQKPYYQCVDLPKKVILPGTSDTIIYNLLKSANYFVKGKYRFKAYVRTRCRFENGRGTYEQPLLPVINYVKSDWIYFEILNPIYKSIQTSQ